MEPYQGLKKHFSEAIRSRLQAKDEWMDCKGIQEEPKQGQENQREVKELEDCP